MARCAVKKDKQRTTTTHKKFPLSSVCGLFIFCFFKKEDEEEEDMGYS